MGMFFDLVLENRSDAELVLKYLSKFQGKGLTVVGEDQVVLNDPAFSMVVFDRKLSERSKSILSQGVSHQVNYGFNVSIENPNEVKVGDFMCNLLADVVPKTSGCISFYSYGESLLLRKTAQSLDLYDVRCFWDAKRITLVSSWLANGPRLHEEVKFLD